MQNENESSIMSDTEARESYARLSRMGQLRSTMALKIIGNDSDVAAMMLKKFMQDIALDPFSHGPVLRHCIDLVRETPYSKEISPAQQRFDELGLAIGEKLLELCDLYAEFVKGIDGVFAQPTGNPPPSIDPVL